MKRAVAAFFLTLAVGCSALGQLAAPERAPVRFRPVDVYVDSGGQPLAAYQLTFVARGADVKITGIEGGGHPAFKEPPYYDPKAMQRERVVIAAFSTQTATSLPKGRTRVATIHLRLAGSSEPYYEVTLATAATAKGKKITASASTTERRSP
jgi:hypothetical protein